MVKPYPPKALLLDVVPGCVVRVVIKAPTQSVELEARHLTSISRIGVSGMGVPFGLVTVALTVDPKVVGASLRGNRMCRKMTPCGGGGLVGGAPAAADWMGGRQPIGNIRLAIFSFEQARARRGHAMESLEPAKQRLSPAISPEGSSCRARGDCLRSRGCLNGVD